MTSHFYPNDFAHDGQWSFDTAAECTKHSPSDVDLFDQDIDNLAIDLEETYHDFSFINASDLSFVKGNTPAARNEPSAFTVSSASEYDSVYDTFSSYNPGASPPSEYSTHSLAQELSQVDQDMHRLGIHSPESSVYLPSSSSDTSSPGSLSLASFSPVAFSRASFSDYEPAAASMPQRIRSSASDYFPEASRYTQAVIGQGTVSLANVSAQQVDHSAYINGQGLEQNDLKKKYECDFCHRAFARQFNLKTHRQTHDPNRAKPHACVHKGCGRAFSRKHDLMRHVTSIHRSGTPTSETSIGVGSSPRTRCEECGKSVVAGKEAGCDCADVK